MRNKKAFGLLMVISLLFIIGSLGALSVSAGGCSCCPINPPQDTAISAHGNTDWHIDTAEEFLFGTDMGGTVTAPNHCPDSWTRNHMHVGLSNTNHFYYDSDLTTPGDDTDGTNGIDTAMLFFYAGHGNPVLWNTLGNNASQDKVSIGDCPGGGLLRYYWQCSCQVFAHGPLNCPGSSHSYSCPGDFDGSADSYSMRNVYERWGPALTKYLRMACGASTSAYCHESQMNSIWNNYLNNSYDVADSFIGGLRGAPWSSWVVPLCITMGGSDVTATPLYDATFTNQANSSGTSHYHIQYVENFESTPISPVPVLDIPLELPILEVRPLPLPSALTDVKFEIEDDFMVSPEEVAERGPKVRVNRLSGAVYALGERQLDVEGSVLKEGEYVEHALRFIEENGWIEEYFAEPMGTRFMLATMPVKGEPEDAQQFQKNVIVTLKRQIDVDGVLVNVLGEGGTMAVQMNNDGSVFNASKVWREIVGVKQLTRIKTFEEAYKEALEQIENSQAYELDSWTWGYKEAAGNIEQTELRVVFHFWFLPADPEAELDYPPLMIEIPGHLQR
jgi:hypothetical protein